MKLRNEFWVVAISTSIFLNVFVGAGIKELLIWVMALVLGEKLGMRGKMLVIYILLMLFHPVSYHWLGGGVIADKVMWALSLVLTYFYVVGLVKKRAGVSEWLVVVGLVYSLVYLEGYWWWKILAGIVMATRLSKAWGAEVKNVMWGRWVLWSVVGTVIADHVLRAGL